MTELKEILENAPLSALVKPGQKIALLEHNMTVGDALRLLAKHDILSAPLVMQADLEDSGDINMSPSLLGWLDIQDILAAFLSHLKTCGHEIPLKMLALMTALEKEGPKFANKTLITIRAADDRGLMYQADSESTSVLTAIKDLFLQTANGEPKVAHRIVLFNAHGEVTSIISQMDVARWLLTQEAAMGPDAHKSIYELGMLTGKPNVVSVSPNMPTLMAYDLMAQEGVSGAPVITDEGELIANISVSDLRSLVSEHFSLLALPVAEFLALEHNTAYIGYSVNASDHSKHPFFASSKRAGGPKKTDIQLHTITPTSTLLQTLHAFVDTHIHRLYVTDPRSDMLKVDAVLTLTDVLRLLAGVW